MNVNAMYLLRKCLDYIYKRPCSIELHNARLLVATVNHTISLTEQKPVRCFGSLVICDKV